MRLAAMAMVVQAVAVVEVGAAVTAFVGVPAEVVVSVALVAVVIT
jgi:hypothetical protein